MLLYSTRPGALPRRFRRTRLLLVGCGDVGQRMARQLQSHPGLAIAALSASPEKAPVLHQMGLKVVQGNLDLPNSLNRLAGWAQRVLHLAPPPNNGWTDPRTRALLLALARRSLPKHIVYGSTTGVYGDRKGAVTPETAPLKPQSPRGHRRVSAETGLMAWGLTHHCSVSVLRIPGIYAPDRSGASVRERLLKQTPVLVRSEDVFTSHIHADDLARACWLALWRAQPQRRYNVNDDTRLRMGDYYDLLADMNGLPRPPRVSRQQAGEKIPLGLLSFMGESKRLRNERMKNELGLVLRYATVREGWAIKSLF
jgi:nucleoside-diphosphate-sugar epimerase